MTPNTPRFPNDPMDYDLPPHTDWSAGGCGKKATLQVGPAAYVCV